MSLGALKPATNGRLSPAVLLDVDFCQNRYVWQSMTAAEVVGLREDCGLFLRIRRLEPEGAFGRF